jgi:hypothetical protein
MYPREGPANFLYRTVALGQRGPSFVEKANLGNLPCRVKQYPKNPYERNKLILRENFLGP